MNQSIKSTSKKNETDGIYVSELGFVADEFAQEDLSSFGKYELIDKIGSGGMGMVFKARQLPTDRLVALKIIAPAYLERLASSDESNVQQRFVSEARIAAAIDQENVVKVFEAGEEDGIAYLAMELIDGPTLAERLRWEHVISSNEVARIFLAVAQGLAAVHDAEVVHRDISPRNIFLGTDGRVCLGDFGLAKRLNETQRLTETKTLMGTVPYLSPEQTRGAEFVSPRSDIYALGATMYHALCGRAPFVAESDAGLIRQIDQYDPVCPTRVNPDVKSDLAAVCLKCLEKDPRQRYQNGAELRDDLARFVGGQPTVARPIGPIGRAIKFTRRKPWMVASTMLVLGLIASLLGVSLFGWNYTSRLNGQLTASLRREEDAAAELAMRHKQAIEAIQQAHLQVANAPHLLPSIAGNENLRVDLNLRGIELLEDLRDNKLGDFVDEGLIKAFHSLGVSYQQIGRHRDAITALETSLEEINEHPRAIARGDKLHLLAKIHHEMAKSLKAIGQQPKAIQAMHDSRDAYQQLARATNNGLESQVGLGECHNQLAIASNDLDEQLKHFRQAVETFERLKDRQDFNEGFDNRKEFAVSLYNLALATKHKASLEGSRELLEQSLKWIEQSIQIREQLVLEYPKRLMAKYHLAGTINVRGELIRRMGDNEAGRNESLRALKIIEELAEQNPGVPKYEMEVVSTHMQLQSGQAADVRKPHLVEASRRIDALVAKVGVEDVDVLFMAARVHLYCGNFFSEQNAVEIFESHFLTAVELIRGLLGNNPRNEGFLNFSGDLITSFASAYRANNLVDQAIEKLQLVEEFQELMPADADLPAWDRARSKIYEQRFDLLKRLNRPEEALQALKNSIEFARTPDEQDRLRQLIQEFENAD